MQSDLIWYSIFNMKIIHIVLIGCMLLASSLLSGCASLSKYKEAPILNLVNLELLESSPFEQRYQLKFRIQNPNSESLPMTGMHFTLEVNGKKFMTGLSHQSVTIPAFSDTVIDATGTTTLFGIARQLQGLQSSNKASFDYRLSGKLSIQDLSFSIPFDITDTLRLD